MAAAALDSVPGVEPGELGGPSFSLDSSQSAKELDLCRRRVFRDDTQPLVATEQA